LRDVLIELSDLPLRDQAEELRELGHGEFSFKTVQRMRARLGI